MEVVKKWKQQADKMFMSTEADVLGVISWKTWNGCIKKSSRVLKKETYLETLKISKESVE